MKCLLNLYVIGKTEKSLMAIQNLKKLLKKHEETKDCELRIIDISEHPELADKKKIIATPTLERKLPQPIRRIIGDLSDEEKVLIGLEMA